MIVKYTPEGSEETFEYPFRPGRLLVAELELIERQTGMLYDEWVLKVNAASAIAVNAFLYVMRKREQPDLRWGQLQWTMDEVAFDMDEVETRQMIDQYKAALDEANTEAQKTALKQQISELSREIGDPDPYADVNPDDVVEGEVVQGARPAKKAAAPKDRSPGSGATKSTSHS